MPALSDIDADLMDDLEAERRDGETDSDLVRRLLADSQTITAPVVWQVDREDVEATVRDVLSDLTQDADVHVDEDGVRYDIDEQDVAVRAAKAVRRGRGPP